MQASKRNARGNQTFLLLKDSLFALLEEKAAGDITVDDICQRCGVTKGAFYHHFASRDELMSLALTTRMNDFMAAEVAWAYRQYPQDPALQIRHWVNSIVDFSVRYRTDIGHYLYKGSHSSSWRHIVSDWNRLVQERLCQWQSEGRLRSDVTAEELHAYCDSFTYGFSALFAAEYVQNPIPPCLLESFISTLLANQDEKKPLSL